MNPQDLSDEQRAVVDSVLANEGRFLVLGGPGAGKTTTALCAARAYLDELGPNDPQRVLFLTFSRAAVSQIANRGRAILAGVEDRVEILTFHALAFRILGMFGRYNGRGLTPPQIQSVARRKLLGATPSHLSYDDLLPMAVDLLARSTLFTEVLRKRWRFIICDEVQDTNPIQWQLVELLDASRALLLGDPDQMIYTGFDGVSLEHFSAISGSVDETFLLPEKSHRDPSGIIPSLAKSVRLRRFGDDSVRVALAQKRLKRVHYRGPLKDALENELKALQDSGVRDIGIFAHSNITTSEIGRMLHDLGVEHEMVGLPEAHTEALGAMVAQLQYAVGTATEDDVRQGLACFITASVRGANVPLIAQGFLRKASLPSSVEQSLGELLTALKATDWDNVGQLLEAISQSWSGLGLVEGRRNWTRAASHLLRLAASVLETPPSDAIINSLTSTVALAGSEALLSMSSAEAGEIRLMNYHQTKGKEADVVIHIYTENDYFGPESEPFPKNSKLLGVAISRARKQVILLLPPRPHPLVAPFLPL